jgi:hypothetical protein
LGCLSGQWYIHRSGIRESVVEAGALDGGGIVDSQGFCRVCLNTKCYSLGNAGWADIPVELPSLEYQASLSVKMGKMGHYLSLD